MAIVRRINKRQISECEGNEKTGFVYCIKGLELDGVSEPKHIIIKGKKNKNRVEAAKSAWDAAKAWLTQIGDIKEIKGIYITQSVD